MLLPDQFFKINRKNSTFGHTECYMQVPPQAFSGREQMSQKK